MLSVVTGEVSRAVAPDPLPDVPEEYICTLAPVIGCVPARTLPATRIDCVVGIVGVVGDVGSVGSVVPDGETTPPTHPVRVTMPHKERISRTQAREMDFMKE